MHQPLWRRLLNGYLFADLSYVMFMRRFPRPGIDAEARAAQDAYWTGSGVTAWIVWTASGLVGIALGHSVPEAWGLGFAGTLALIAIMCSLVTSAPRAVAAAIAGTVAVAAYALPLKLYIVVAIVVAVALCIPLERAPSEEVDRDGEADGLGAP
jgi:predicted branched-subunit amino acid permease